MRRQTAKTAALAVVAPLVVLIWTRAVPASTATSETSKMGTWRGNAD